MSGEILDRRVRKTRSTLRKCLAQLLAEKKIQEISVKEISEMADINRGTFYLHYKDIYDLLSSIETEIFEQFSAILDKHDFEDVRENPLNIMTDLFVLVSENADLTRILLGPNGDIQFLTRLLNAFQEKALDPWVKHAGPEKANDAFYWSSYTTQGCIGIIKAWLDSGMNCPPEEAAMMVAKLVILGASSLFSIPRDYKIGPKH